MWTLSSNHCHGCMGHISMILRCIRPFPVESHVLEKTQGLLNVTVRSWLSRLSMRGRGVSGQPPAEPTRSQSDCLNRGQALADGRGGTQDALLGARGSRLKGGFGKEPGRRGHCGPRSAGCKESRLPQRGGSSKPLEIPSDLPRAGQEREWGGDAAAGELPPWPP